jgi:2-polyprenyl-3-methyl-5-hydroxy-6-metoxy-1,4-benzoquinol methylase
MQKKIFFSKKSSDISKIKINFTKENKSHLRNVLRINKLYIKQKKRISCKNCEKKLLKESFSSFLVKYYICPKCTHLNGGHYETKKFLSKIYTQDNGMQYAKNYLKSYNKRLENIYEPKIKFYKKILGKNSFIELGSGIGYFLHAAEKKKINGTGYETNKTMVKVGKKRLKKNKLLHCNIDNLKNIIKTSDKECLVLIGVLEHLENPNEIIRLFKLSKFKYLFFSLPLYSFSSILENIFPKIYPRQLGGAHTHLYTKDSIKYLIKKNNFKILGEWWFGQDFLDLKRSLLNSFDNKKIDKNFINSFDQFFGKYIDQFQNVLDKNLVSSEVHMIIKK